MGTSLEAELLLSIAVTVTSEQQVESVLQRTVQGLAAQPGVALTRIWLLPSIHIPSSWRQPPDAPEGIEQLHLVASAGTPINSQGEDWSFLQGHFARVPFDVGKVGQVAAERHPILIKDIAYEDSWIVRPEWAKREGIRSFAGYPLIFRDNLLGVIAVFSRRPLADKEFDWLGLFANHAAVAIANARAFEDLKRAEEALRLDERNLSLTLNTISTFIAVCGPDGSILSVNQAALDYHGITFEDVQKEDFRSRWFHPDDMERLSEELREALPRPERFECEYRALGKDGKYRWFLVRYNPLLDDQGRIERWYVIAFDIEDRKGTEEALRKSERQFRLLVETIPALVWRSTPEGDLDYLNRRAVEYLGHTAESLAGGRWVELVHPDHRDATLQRWMQSATTGTAYEDEYQLRRADGQYRWIQSVGEPFLDTEGRIANWYGLVFDIEDRKRAEVEVQKSEAKLRQVIDAIPALAWCNLPDGPNEFLNKGWHEYTGLSAEESHGWGWQDAFHPEDLPSLMERWLKMLTSGEPDAIEARLRRHDGVYRWFLIRAEPFRDESGKIVRWYGTSTDIDDRKRAEEKLRRSEAFLAEAQQLSLTGSFTWRVATDEITWSEELYRIYEIKFGEPVTLELIRTRVHPEDVSLLEKMKMVHQAGGGDTNFEWQYRLLMPNRSIKYMQAVAHATRDQDGQLEYIGAIQDVTERKFAEEALTRARSELAHMARVTTLSALTASIAHEINQPIAAAVTSAGACLRWLNRDQPEVQRAREAALRIEEDGKRAAEIITHLKSFYKKDVSPQREMVSVNDLVGEMLVLLRSEASRHSVVMRAELASDLPSVTADRVQLQQVLMNLMLNGMEAMSERGGELKLTTRRESGEVMVSVSDTGAGIPADKMEEIFNAFVTTKAGGTGMGLAVSSTIIESHGGRLWATVNPGRGATFHFTLQTEPEA